VRDLQRKPLRFICENFDVIISHTTYFPLQMCDIKEDTYYCMQHAIEYLQSKKPAQRKHCKLLYTHSKEEISAIIKSLNR